MGSEDAAQADMRSMTLRLWPSDPLPVSLTEEQKIAYAAFNLEKHIEETKDKIRLNALCEAHYADPDASPTPFPRIPRSSPPPNTFRQAARSTWKPGTPVPTVKTSRKTQPVFHMQECNSKVAIAKKTIARLDEYDAATKPLLDAVKLAKEGRAPGSPAGGRDGGVGERGAESTKGEERSRDPRLLGRKL